eukprot:TRINITY_DN28831_c0_g2_i1.p1 TRINITY_DN28831_c0_g2~~TRINITY_DN28831_c0_g2_i1.p1  ORF type:complete len:704 (+),score=67.60 TRINITY_DN28831_c0_g2_i1:30-2114(+)
MYIHASNRSRYEPLYGEHAKTEASCLAVSPSDASETSSETASSVESDEQQEIHAWSCLLKLGLVLVLTCLVVVSFVLEVALPFAYGGFPTESAYVVWQQYWSLVITGAIAGAVAVFITSQASTYHLRLSAMFVSINWLGALMSLLTQVCLWFPTHVRSELPYTLERLLSVFSLFCLIEAILDSVLAFAEAMPHRREFHWFRYFGRLMWVSLILQVTLRLASCTVFLPTLQKVNITFLIVFLLSVLGVLMIPHFELRGASKEFKDVLGVDSLRVLATMRRQRLVLVTVASVHVCRMITAVEHEQRGALSGSFLYELHQWLKPADTLCQAIGVVALSAVCSVAKESNNSVVYERKRAQLRAATTRAWQPSSSAQWQGKVEELARRGITLEALLDFYRSLSDVMPHFDADVHTTADVVRQAIIPLSRSGSCAFSSLAHGNAQLSPSKLVSHTWGGKFLHLVAAVVADALGETEFTSSVFLLKHHMAGLVKELRRSGRLHDVYWICAFCVSQHSSICASNPRGERDSVTRRVHPTCNCGASKYFNDSPPLRADGKSISCELNKFSDMISFLAASNERFEQVIAVDEHFDLFNRAWVVAEIARSHSLGVRQNMKVMHASALSEHTESLKLLQIEQMRASRPEDVQEILSTIPDKAAFNQYLQDLLFNRRDGLLHTWKSGDTAQRMRILGRLSRLLHMAR